MKQFTDKLAPDIDPIYDMGGSEHSFYLDKNKQFTECFDEQKILRLPLSMDLSDEDIDNFKAKLLEMFPAPLNKLLDLCIVVRGSERGVFAGFDRDVTLESS
jgi:hypothetical protein